MNRGHEELEEDYRLEMEQNIGHKKCHNCKTYWRGDDVCPLCDENIGDENENNK